MKARRAITQSILQRQNRLGKKKLAVSGICGAMRSNIWVTGVPEEGKWQDLEK